MESIPSHVTYAEARQTKRSSSFMTQLNTRNRTDGGVRNTGANGKMFALNVRRNLSSEDGRKDELA